MDLHSDPRAKDFRTVLSRGLRKGVNFAGEYTVVEWGCGTGCQTQAILHTQTGKVVAWVSSSCGAHYRPDSRLFILNPDPAQDNPSYCKVEYFLMESGKLKPLPRKGPPEQ